MGEKPLSQVLNQGADAMEDVLVKTAFPQDALAARDRARNIAQFMGDPCMTVLHAIEAVDMALRPTAAHAGIVQDAHRRKVASQVVAAWIISTAGEYE